MFQMSNESKTRDINAEIRDLQLDYMRGLVDANEYNRRLAEIQARLEKMGISAAEIRPTQGIVVPEFRAAKSSLPERKVAVDPVTAVRKAIERMRRMPLERIAQDAGVPTHVASRILADLLDGREISGRIDHDSGDFILGTGSGPAPKTISVCPYCRTELKRIAVKGETVTCSMCRESFVVV